MDPQSIAQLADSVVKTLQPLLPYFLQAAAAEAGRRTAGAAWDTLASLWEKLRSRGRVEEDAKYLVQHPDVPEALVSLRLTVRRALEEDPALAQEIAGLMARPEIVSIVETGSVEDSEVTGVKGAGNRAGDIQSIVKTKDVKKSKIIGVDLSE